MAGLFTPTLVAELLVKLAYFKVRVPWSLKIAPPYRKVKWQAVSALE